MRTSFLLFRVNLVHYFCNNDHALTILLAEILCFMRNLKIRDRTVVIRIQILILSNAFIILENGYAMRICLMAE